VLVPAAPDGYAFRHALLAEAVYDDLLPGERVRLHAAYAAVLRTSTEPGSAAELARHARAANDRATAVRASIRAGDDAMALAGPDEATRHYEVALELIGEGGAAVVGDAVGAGLEPIDPVGVAIKGSEAAAAAGHPFRGLALVQDQLTALPADAPPLDRARLLVAVAGAALLTDTGADLGELTSEALELVPTDPPTPLRAELLSLHARTTVDRGRDEDAARWAGEALALARTLRLPAVAADAMTTLARIDERAGDPEASQLALERTLREAKAAGQVAVELRGLFNLGSLHYEAGRLAEAADVFRTGAERARHAGRPWGPYGLESRVLGGLVAYVAGDWDAAERLFDASGQAPPPLSEAVLAAGRLALEAGRGSEHGVGAMERLRTWWARDGMVAIFSGTAGIDVYGDRGDVEGARATYRDLVAHVAELWQQPDFAARVRLSSLLVGQLAGPAGRATAAERAALAAEARGAHEAAGRAFERLRGRARPVGPEARAWMARVEAEHARLRWLADIDPPGEGELVAVWQRAVDAFEAFGHVFESARSRARLAAVLRAAGRLDEAAAVADLARATAQRLGARPLLVELQALHLAVPSPRTHATRTDDALTAREREVLALVAEGRSNSEIGRQLFISAKTVSVHVSNMLAKLGAGGRTEAVAVARRRGLLSDDGVR
jgi:ATP/maltotriose-dependent transcriptional regulator MalT